MSAEAANTELVLAVQPTDASAEDRERASENLIEELRQVRGVGRIGRLPGAELTKGSKSGMTHELAEIIIALGSAGALLPTLANVLKAWLLRQRQLTKIRVKAGDRELTLSGEMAADDIEKALKAAAAFGRSD
jgi:hypothetical protein